MTNRHASLYHTETNQPAGKVLKQELITYEQTDYGIKISRLERSFGADSHSDSYESKPLPLGPQTEPEAEKKPVRIISKRRARKDDPIFNGGFTISSHRTPPQKPTEGRKEEE